MNKSEIKRDKTLGRGFLYWLIMVLMFPYFIFIAFPVKRFKEQMWTVNKATGKKEFEKTVLIWLAPVGLLFGIVVILILYSLLLGNGLNVGMVVLLVVSIAILSVEAIFHYWYGGLGKKGWSKLSSQYSSYWFVEVKLVGAALIASGRFMTDKEKESKFPRVKVISEKVVESVGSREHGLIIQSSIKGNEKDEIVLRHTSDDSHALIIGSTRSGKTSRLINPQVQFLANTKEKPSMIISDVKGELFDFHAHQLEEKGYKVLSLNLLERGKTDYWNPLEKIWNDWGVKNPKELEDLILEEERDKVQEAIQDLCNSIVPTDKGDIWEEGSRGMAQFLILGMLEQADVDDNITLATFNLANISYNLNSSTVDQLKGNWTLLKQISEERFADGWGSGISRAVEMGGKYIVMPEDTAAGISGNLASRLKSFASVKVRLITSKTTITLEDEEKPLAIFVKVPHSKKSNWGFVSMFINEMYKELIESIGRKRRKHLKRSMYFILDEFGNFPPLTQLDSMISIGAGHHIYFVFVVQALSQIVKAYDEDTKSNLMSNVAYKYYLMSGDEDTKEQISKAMGEIEIQSYSESESSGSGDKKNNSNSVSTTKKRVMSAEELGTLKEGEAIILSIRNKPLKANLAPYWTYKPFNKELNLITSLSKVFRKRDDGEVLSEEDEKLLLTSLAVFLNKHETAPPQFDKKVHYYAWTLAEPN